MTTAPAELDLPDVDWAAATARPWVTIVWDDPINLMSYVSWVFQRHFHYPEEKAEMLMLQVHQEGKAVVSAGSREEMERDVAALHRYGLWATLASDGGED